MDIETDRNQIDKIDEELLRLVNERAKLALSILKFKKENQLPVFDPDREKRILELLQLKNPGPLQKKAIARIFSVIIEEHRNLEEEKDS
jgi:chorismate mutase